MMAFLLDLARVVWIVTLIAVIVWAPAALLTRRWLPPLAAILEQLVVTLAIVTVAISLLSPAHLLNPFMLGAAYLAWPARGLVFMHRRTLTADAIALSRRLTLATAVKLERAGTLTTTLRSLPPAPQSIEAQRASLMRAMTSPGALVVIMSVVVLVVPKLAATLAFVRLATPAAYAELLTAQRLFVGDLGWHRPDVAADITTALSVVSSISAAHLVRLLTPLAPAIVLLVMAAVLRLMTASRGPAVAAALVAAVIGAGSVPTLAGATAALLLMLTTFFLHQAIRRRERIGVAATAGILFALTAPMLTTAGNAPFGVALIVAGVVWIAERRFQFARPPVRTASATAVALLALAVVVPRSASASYVEYDAAARQVLRIAGEFPKFKWMVAAPVEEWVLSYGRGWHLNLHQFVEEVGPRTNDPGFRLPYHVDELFVFVETRPFATYATEPADVPFKTLIDPVYRHYRSPAGRASLQFAAYKISEQLLRQTPSSVYYEDGRLKIYRFQLR
ncbi:MAG: hypothetical protein K2Y23_00660 [Cyanobacteria bacterium]|nr:hypothetical protein [Cyanobacteriota bacterium]